MAKKEEQLSLPAAAAAANPNFDVLDSEKIAIAASWEEFKYRNALYWSIFFNFAGAIAVLCSIPFLKGTDLGNARKYAYIFPIMSSIASILGSWLLYAEYWRMRIANSAYKSLIRRVVERAGTSERTVTENVPFIVRTHVAPILCFAFLVSGLALSIASFMILRAL